MPDIEGIDPHATPVATTCLDCESIDGWWVHLRRCALCAHIGCCDSSVSKHAAAHFAETGHPIVQSFEPDETWFWNYSTKKRFFGPKLAEPRSRPLDQPSPGPIGRVPDNWRDLVDPR